MAKDYRAITADISAYAAEPRAIAPDAMQEFHALAKAAGAEGAVDAKTKELIALAIGVTRQCDGCIGFHARALTAMGATRRELGETLAMCVYMGGGPALMYAADALCAFDEFSGVAA